MSKIKNPFIMKGYVSPEYFCDRKEETQKLIDAAVNGRDVTLFSLRRMGKSGLLHNAGYYLKKEHEFVYIYSDIYNTENIEELASELTTNVIQQLYPEKSMLEKITQYFTHLRPQISFDTLSGLPQVQLLFSKPNDVYTSLEELFNMVNQHGKTVYWAIDEFQQINQYPQKDSMLKQLRFLTHKSENIRFVFSGSHTNMLLSVFSNAKEPFFKSTQMLELKEIAKSEYIQFITNHFEKAGKTIDNQSLDLIMEYSLSHTWYTQSLCNRLFQNYKNVSEKEVKTSMQSILEESEITFYRFRQLFTKGQWELLKAIGNEEYVFQPTASTFLKKHDLGSSASVLKALAKLINDEFVVEQYDKESRFYRLNDVFLMRWIQWMY